MGRIRRHSGGQRNRCCHAEELQRIEQRHAEELQRIKRCHAAEVQEQKQALENQVAANLQQSKEQQERCDAEKSQQIELQKQAYEKRLAQELQTQKQAFEKQLAAKVQRFDRHKELLIQKCDQYLKQYQQELNAMKKNYQQQLNMCKSLEDELCEARNSNKKLLCRMNEIEASNAMDNPGNSYSDSSATPTLMNTMITRVRESALSFAKVLHPHAEAWDFHYTFAKKKHKQFAMASHVCCILFSGFECHDFLLNEGYMDASPSDPEEVRSKCVKMFQKFQHMDITEMLQDPEFERFFLWKRSNFCWNLADTPPEVQESFVKLAKMVWLLHKVALSFYPSAVIPLRFSDDGPLDDQLMETVGIDEEDHLMAEKVVGFMVIPGFRVRTQVFKSLVYPKLSIIAKS